MIRLRKCRKGFTIMELLLAMFILLLIVSGITAVYLMSVIVWREESAHIVLQRKASIAMEKMVRGVEGINGIREASSEVGKVVCPNAYTIRYESGIDGIERSFYLGDDEIIYDPNTSIVYDEFSITEKVSTLTFAVSGEIVAINLSVEDEVRDKVITVNLSTKVKLRN